MQKDLLIIERIELLRKALGLNMSAFETSLDTRSTIRDGLKNKTDIRVSWLTKILEVYPNVSPKWLLTGKGSMYLNEDIDRLSFSDEIEMAAYVHENIHDFATKEHWQKILNYGNTLNKENDLESRLRRIEKKLNIRPE